MYVIVKRICIINIEINNIKHNQGGYNKKEGVVLLKSFYLGIKESKNYFLLVSCLFVVGFIMGYFLIDSNSNLMKVSLEKIGKVANEINERDSVVFTIITIFKNNLLIAFLMIVLGLFLGVYPAFAIFMNGLIIGAYIEMIYAKIQSISFILLGMIPHGIFEIPAIIVAAGFGIRLGFLLVKVIVEKFSVKSNKEYQIKLINAIKQTPAILIGISVILLIAAIIESTISVYLLNIIK